jgi:hypothetical protein
MSALSFSSLEAKAALVKTWRASQRWWKWIAAFFLGLGVLLVVTYLLRKINARSEELASLRTEAEQKEIEAAQRAHLAKTEPNRLRAAEFERQAQGLRDEVVLIRRQLDRDEAEHNKVLEQIKNINEWAELDKYNLSGR